jgi:hypothetical protein
MVLDDESVDDSVVLANSIFLKRSSHNLGVKPISSDFILFMKTKINKMISILKNAYINIINT